MSHEEADTKIILHAMHLMKVHNVNVKIFSPSGDTDIIILLLALFYFYQTILPEHILIIDRHGKDNKILKSSNINLEENLIDPLTGFYAITVKDYMNSFLRKGKKNVLGY